MALAVLGFITSSIAYIVIWFVAKNQMRHKINDAWADGCVAACRCAPIKCPFDAFSIEGIWWNRGYSHMRSALHER